MGGQGGCFYGRALTSASQEEAQRWTCEAYAQDHSEPACVVCAQDHSEPACACVRGRRTDAHG